MVSFLYCSPLFLTLREIQSDQGKKQRSDTRNQAKKIESINFTRSKSDKFGAPIIVSLTVFICICLRLHESHHRVFTSARTMSQYNSIFLHIDNWWGYVGQTLSFYFNQAITPSFLHTLTTPIYQITNISPTFQSKAIY